jgi:hypothetical protein
MRAQLESLNMDISFLNRNVNEGFSGGEKKRNEILQLSVLEVIIRKPYEYRMMYAWRYACVRHAVPNFEKPTVTNHLSGRVSI